MTSEHTNFPAVSEGAIGAVQIQTVNARDLHAFLEVGKVFGAWIVDRIAQYGFVQGQDYEVFEGLSVPETESAKARPQKTKEYAISIDMAKELSMVERNAKGKQARAYFLECERRAKDPSAALNNPAMLRHLLLENVEKVLALEGQVEEMRPQVQALERIAVADGSLCVTDAAKTLQVRPKDLFAFLRSHGWIYRRIGSDHDVAYQPKLASGLLEHKTTTVYRSDGSEKVTTQVRVTPKGLARLAREFPPIVEAA